MSWNLKDSKERIQKHLDEMGEIEIMPLVREADLDTLLSETRCRDILGSHIYVDVSNFTRLASQDVDGDDYKRLIQGVHLYQREVGRIIKDIFDSTRIHFQGPKLHVLTYRPIRDEKELASRAMLMELVLKDFVVSVFNPAFPKLGNFSVAAGASLGEAVGTRNGPRGDRELLFLGAPANYAAKIIGGTGSLKITESLYDSLPDDLQDICLECEDGNYQLRSLTCSELDDLLEKYDIEWEREASAKRIEDDKRAFPLSSIEYREANALIDLDALSINHNKRVLAASIFADVAGFTAYIDAAQDAKQEKEALRVFHAIRREMARVVQKDYGALRIQFQGDRLQGLIHLPKNDETAIALQAVEIAAALQSSLESAIKSCLPEAESLHLAVGIDMGRTLVSKLGTRAHRDRVCLGEAVQLAAQNEERIGGEETGISKTVYDLLSEDVRDQFKFRAASGFYVAFQFTMEVWNLLQKARDHDEDKPVSVIPGSGGATVITRPVVGAGIITPARSYAPKG